MSKQPHHSAVPAVPAGVVRLLRLQALLLAVCVGLGAVLYGVPPVLATAALVLTVAAALSVWPVTRHWGLAVLGATGLMYLLATVLPPGWLQGPVFVVLALASAAAGLLLGVNRS